MKRNKLITLGALLTSSLIVTLPLASCASTVESDYFYALKEGSSEPTKYSFQDVESYDWNTFSFVMKASDCGCASTKVYVNEKVIRKYLDWKGK